ncbi:MAG: catalase-related domain-containing protein [Cyanobacteria bacterium J06649_11]
MDLGDVAVDRYDHREGNDDYSQTRDLYRLMSEDAKERLAENIVSSLGEVPEEIQKRQLCQFFCADVDYGRRIAKKLGIEVDSSFMSQEKEPVRT